jgi:hypothetical protein
VLDDDPVAEAKCGAGNQIQRIHRSVDDADVACDVGPSAEQDITQLGQNRVIEIAARSPGGRETSQGTSQAGQQRGVGDTCGQVEREAGLALQRTPIASVRWTYGVSHCRAASTIGANGAGPGQQ